MTASHPRTVNGPDRPAGVTAHLPGSVKGVYGQSSWDGVPSAPAVFTTTAVAQPAASRSTATPGSTRSTTVSSPSSRTSDGSGTSGSTVKPPSNADSVA